MGPLFLFFLSLSLVEMTGLVLLTLQLWCLLGFRLSFLNCYALAHSGVCIIHSSLLEVLCSLKGSQWGLHSSAAHIICINNQSQERLFGINANNIENIEDVQGVKKKKT